MIYPKAIFRTVIALSTVAAAAQATAVSPRSSSAGAKRGKGGRYVDTTTNAYGATGTDVVLPAGYPAGYAPNGVNVQAGASLRKITSPNNVGVQFSAASPSNVAKGTSGYVNLAANTYGSPRSLDNKKDVKGGVETGKKTNANYGTPAAPASPAKGGNYGAKIPIAPSSGGVKIGGNVSPSSGGVKDAKGGYGAKTNEDTNYGRDPPNGNTSGNYGKRDNGGKGVEFPVSPSSGGYTNGKGKQGWIQTDPVPAPNSPTKGSPRGKSGSAVGGSKSTNPTPNSPTGNGPKGGQGGSDTGNTNPVPAPNSPTKGSPRGKNGSAVGGSKSTNPTPNSPTGNGPKGGQGGSNTGITNPVPAPYGPTPKGGQGGKSGSAVGGSKSTNPTPTGYGPKGGQSGPAASSPIVNQGGTTTLKGAYGGNGGGSKGGKSGSTAGSKASTATTAPTPATNAPAPATQYNAKQSSNKYAKQSGRK
ncbi:hypothetical protein PR003_g23548 [Phytophthora rubi]|nr:hypothetical protein PR001_g22382 [Phytophthora rubi]KAE9297240.1 hypothetical protein PR003_g23548 [Phytophthora rubi]